MRTIRLGVPAFLLILAAAGSIACSGGYGNAAPGGTYGGNTGGTGGNGGNGGGGQAGAVTVGTGIQFVSSHNASTNPAVDTITAGSAMTWTWTGNLPHSVRSTGTPSFTSSGVQTGAGSYSVTFATPGTYKYDCSVHGGAMTGTIVVLPAAANANLNDVTGVLR